MAQIIFWHVYIVFIGLMFFAWNYWIMMLKSDKVGLFIKNVFYQKGVFPFFMFTDNKISKSDRGHFFEKKSDFSPKKSNLLWSEFQLCKCQML